MQKVIRSLALAGLLAGLTAGGPLQAAGSQTYEVTVTNVTRGQIFTPILVATHEPGVTLFELGAPASLELEALAESGDVGPLSAALSALPEVKDVTSSGGVLPPGASVTVTVATKGKFRNLSLAAMLVPTNDAFIALNDVRGPRGRHEATFAVPAYDAGSEPNDELCASIPGPPFLCQGEGVSAGSGEGYVHIHAGIHGIGDLDAAERDWRNPVAVVRVRRVHD